MTDTTSGEKKTLMNWDKFAAPVALYLVGQTITALWWASDMTTRMSVVERSAGTVSDGRIARIEAAVTTLAESNRDLKSSINELVREMRKSNN